MFESESFQEQVYNWLENNNLESSKYWKKLAYPIKKKLEGNSIIVKKEGISEFKDWVNSYNNEYIDNSKNSVDLSVFGYNYDNWEEGELWLNPLFDNLLEEYKEELSEIDLLNLINALFNKNEEFADCKATYTAINYLLEKRTLKIELLIIQATLNALEGHEPGHRYFERSLLDRLVDDIFPTFSADSIIKLLENAHPDNIRGEHYGGHGDCFISLAHVVLGKKPNDQQRKVLNGLIEKYSE